MIFKKIFDFFIFRDKYVSKNNILVNSYIVPGELKTPTIKYIRRKKLKKISEI